MDVCVYVYRNISGTTRSISIKFDMLAYFWILNSGKTFIFCFSNYFLFYFNHPIVTNNSANMHLKENKLPTFPRLVLGIDRLVRQIK
ncbi:hypothetical protein TSAR_003033 [Trichomalopsis sarcophagae]|uniref:Uncharacterized protein n=1 Tax=Trichomalopsis sarcophagae TaxID=543379 RepID=A0A232FH24_9HYME|nr:hypothetical protein TSAR_003033 [Trichomalopsis sarcophagae]